MEEFKEIIRQLVGKKQNPKLTKDEKDLMRVRIAAFMRLNNQRSLLTNKLTKMAFLLIVVMLTGGVSFASNNALPGDILYPVKIRVVEKVEGALKISAEAKARWDTELAVRRLQEGEKLVAAGKFDAKTSAKVENDFEIQSKKAEKSIAKLKNKDNAETAVSIGADFENAIRAHQQVLSKLANDNAGASPQIEVIVNKLEMKADAFAEAQAEARTEIEMEVGADDDVDVKTKGKIKIKLDL